MALGVSSRGSRAARPWHAKWAALGRLCFSPSPRPASLCILRGCPPPSPPRPSGLRTAPLRDACRTPGGGGDPDPATREGARLRLEPGHLRGPEGAAPDSGVAPPARGPKSRGAAAWPGEPRPGTPRRVTKAEAGGGGRGGGGGDKGGGGGRPRRRESAEAAPARAVLCVAVVAVAAAAPGPALASPAPGGAPGSAPPLLVPARRAPSLPSKMATPAAVNPPGE